MRLNVLNPTSTAHKVAYNTTFQLIGKLVSMSITILATIIVTRIYSRESFGEFNLMQNIPALFFIIADFGFNAIAAREISKDFKKAEQYLGNILILRVTISVLLMVFGSVAIHFFPYSDSLKIGIYLGMFLILTQALYATTNIVFQVKQRYDLSTVGYILGSIVILILVLVFSHFRLNVMWVNFSYVIGGLVTFLVNVYFLGRFVNLRQSLQFDKNIAKYLLYQSLPLGLMFVFSQINFKADSVLLSVLPVPDGLGVETRIDAVAIYGLSYKIFEVALVIPTFFMNAVYPIYVRNLAESKEKFAVTFKKSIYAMALSGLCVSIVGTLFSPFAIKILGGSEFALSSGVLRLLLIGMPVFYLTQPVSWFLVTTEKQKVLPFVYLIAAFFNVVASLYFIPKFSFYAAAVTTWASEFLILILLVYFSVKEWRRLNA